MACGAKPGAQVVCRRGEAGRPLGSLLYLPPKYEDKGSWPLIVFLHGAGESGDDPSKVALQGPPKLVEKGHPMGFGGKKSPHPFLADNFVVLSPQTHTGQFGGASAKAVVQLIDQTAKDFKIDRSRVYLTGVSMGGFGTWSVALAAPEVFAAIAPVCGGGDPQAIRKSLSGKPIWMFHGENDVVIPVDASDKIYEALGGKGLMSGGIAGEYMGEDPLRYSRFEAPGKDPNWHDGVAGGMEMPGHASWVKAYDESEDLYKWFLSHVRA